MQKLGVGYIVLIIIAIVMVGNAGAQTAQVIGQKFYDYNQNGIYDSDDFPLQCWTIRLYWLNGTAVPGKETTTGLDGTYNISDINPYVSYNVTESVQPGWNPTTPSNYTVYSVTCGERQFEFFTNVSNMVAFMPK